jgi:hypothetical protein
MLKSYKPSTLTFYVPFLPQPTHLGTRVGLDIFVGIERLYRYKHYFVAYDK